MEAVISIRPLLAVLVSAAAVPLILMSRHPNRREGWTFAAAGVKFCLVASLLPMVLAGRAPTFTVAEVLPGAAIQFRVDAMGLLFALIAGFLWIVTSAYSIGYLRGLKEHSQTRYFCFFALALSATIGVAFAANLLTLYLFYEMLSFATYPLVTHHQDAEARSSGRKYLFYIVGASIGLVLPAMIVCYLQAGTLDFDPAGLLDGCESRSQLVFLLLALTFGFAKAAVMPLHAWLPAAMVAPTPVSALLHAVAVVKVGVFSILRVYTGIFGVDLLQNQALAVWVLIPASVTILLGSLIALSQDSLKRLLAFSTIAQLSYIVLGAGLFSARGLIGALMHMGMHAFGKITLFFCAGAIFVAAGKKNISEMAGIGRRMPITMSAFFVGSLSIIGFPPCGGFLSKWYLVLGAVDAGRVSIVVLLLLSSLLNAAYFMPVIYRAFFSRSEDGADSTAIHEAPLFCLIPLVLTALVSLALFFYPQPFFRLARQAAAAVGGG